MTQSPTTSTDGATQAAGRAARAVLDTAVRLPWEIPLVTARVATEAGRTAWWMARHPEELLDRARQLPLAAPMLRDAVVPILTGRVEDWRSEYAYSAGLQAFVYGFPYIDNAQLRHAWVTQPRDPAVIPYAAVGEFWHARTLLDETYRDGGCPNTDTLYSIAWVDLSEEPVVLSHPDMATRYFAFELAGFTSDNFAYVGQRTTGHRAGHFAIVGPDWEGELPDGVHRLDRAPTPWVLVLGRTAVDGADDLPEARTAQQRYRLTPLSRWHPRGHAPTPVSQRRDVYAPTDPAVDPLGPWKTLNAMLAENPPPAHHAPVLGQFAPVGIGPGLDVEAQPAAVKHGLIRAARVGLPLLREQFTSGDWATRVNGWRYPPPQEGRFGDDFLRRAADQSLAGIVANDPAEAVYLVCFEDAESRPFDPAGRYTLRFPAGGLPPVESFWSLAIYTSEDMNLIPNPSHRYSVGDRTPGPHPDPDGGLTIHLQPRPPANGRAPNWLPTSATAPWFLILRLYRPHPEVATAQWRCPGVTRLA